jgi:energy-coupling factor transporter transmembrane protein EcfT
MQTNLFFKYIYYVNVIYIFLFFFFFFFFFLAQIIVSNSSRRAALHFLRSRSGNKGLFEKSYSKKKKKALVAKIRISITTIIAF